MLTKLLLILAALLVSTVSYCAPLREYCLPGDPAGFNPQLANDESTRVASRPLYDRLVEARAIRRGRTTAVGLEPGLAESWEISRDARVYTFQLRRNVAFQRTSFFTPTRSFNVDDVLFSFNRQRLSAHPFHQVGGGNYPDFIAAGFVRNLAQVEKVNEHAVRFHLNQPDPDFLAKLSQDGASILSAEYAETLLSKGTAWDLDQQPVGTGPYLLQRYERAKAILYSANPNYYRARPTNMPPLRLAIVSGASRDEKVKAGQCATSPSFPIP